MTDTPPDDDATQLEEIVVIGVRPQPGTPRLPREEQQEVDPDPNPDPGGGGVWTDADADAENERQEECAAKKFQDDLEDEGEKDDKEFFSFIWDRNGQTATHEIRGGSDVFIGGPEMEAVMTEFGVTDQNIVGFSHNHPQNVYCPSAGTQGFDEGRINAYPSDNDWAAIEGLVGANYRNNVTLYLVGCDGQMRQFPYRQKDEFVSARNARLRPPEPINPQGCEE